MSPPKSPTPEPEKPKHPGGRPTGAQDKKLRRRRRREIAAYKQLGPMPTDPLQGTEHTLAILQHSLAEVIDDVSLSSKERRIEIRAIARSMKDLLPVARLYAAEKAVRSAHDSMLRVGLDPIPTKAPGPGVGPGPLQMTPKA